MVRTLCTSIVANIWQPVTLHKLDTNMDRNTCKIPGFTNFLPFSPAKFGWICRSHPILSNIIQSLRSKLTFLANIMAYSGFCVKIIYIFKIPTVNPHKSNFIYPQCIGPWPDWPWLSDHYNSTPQEGTEGVHHTQFQGNFRYIYVQNFEKFNLTSLKW